MRILDRYVLKKVVSGYMLILVVLIGFFLFIDLSTNLSDILRTKTPPEIVATYYLNMLPWIFLILSRYALLISTLHSFGEANKNNEILSMRASGISITRIAFPVIFFSLAISFFSFFIQEKVLILSQKKVEDIKMQFLKKEKFKQSEEKNLFFSSQDMIFFVRKFSPKKKRMENAMIFKKDPKGNITNKILCQKITYENNAWIAQNVSINTYDEEGKTTGPPSYLKEKKINLIEKPYELAYKRSTFAQFSSLKDLKRKMRYLKKVKEIDPLIKLSITYYHKFADPFSHFFLIIGILPFALEIKKRKVTLSALGIGILFGFVYYCFDSFSIALGEAGIILPLFAPWLTPLFFLIVGFTGLALIK